MKLVISLIIILAFLVASFISGVHVTKNVFQNVLSVKAEEDRLEGIAFSHQALQYIDESNTDGLREYLLSEFNTAAYISNPLEFYSEKSEEACRVFNIIHEYRLSKPDLYPQDAILDMEIAKKLNLWTNVDCKKLAGDAPRPSLP